MMTDEVLTSSCIIQEPIRPFLSPDSSKTTLKKLSQVRGGESVSLVSSVNPPNIMNPLYTGIAT